MGKVVVMAGKITREKTEVKELTPEGVKVSCKYNVKASVKKVMAEVTPIKTVIEEEVLDVDTSFFECVNAKAMEEKRARQAVYEANVARQIAVSQPRKRRKKKSSLIKIVVRLFK